MQNEVKNCIKCNKTKPIFEFTFSVQSGNYLNICLECNKKYHQAYYEKRKAENAYKAVKIDPNATKVCVKCGLEKPLTEFSFDKALNKHINTCKACKCLATKEYYRQHMDSRKEYAKAYAAENQKVRLRRKKYYNEHAEHAKAYNRQYELEHSDEVRTRRKAYRLAHIDEFRERDKEYAKTHREQISRRYKEWCKEHTEQIAEYRKQYQIKNAERISARRKEYDKKNRARITKYYLEKRASDPLFKLSTQARNLINKSLKNRGYGKDTHTYEILGCDYETLWQHLKQTWLENYGQEWNGEDYHIDHIIPLATAKTEQEVKDLCYYKNLQLLKPRDNLVKNKSLEWKLNNNDKE